MRNIQWETYNEVLFTPLSITFLIIMIFLVFSVKKDFLLIPIMIILIFIPYRQRILIYNFDFDFVRIILLFGLLRVIVRNELNTLEINRLDKMFFLWVITESLAYVALRGEVGALVNRIGHLFTYIGSYLIIRLSVTKVDDLFMVIRGLIIMTIVLSLCVLYEKIKNFNIFSIIGGVSEVSQVRNGEIRAQGPFSHPILSGTFGALIFPLIWGFNVYFKKKYILNYLGYISAIIIVLSSASSGPILSLLTAFIGIVLWKYSYFISDFLLFVIFALIGLSIFMDAPVWALLMRVTIIGGSTGYHRYYLVDQAIRRFREWYLMGVSSTAHWGWGLQDITNMYVQVGVNGGIIGLIFFLGTIYLGFNYVWKKTNYIKMKGYEYVDLSKLIWSIGVMHFVHFSTFMGVSYFSNMILFYIFTVGVISSIYSEKKEIEFEHEKKQYTYDFNVRFSK